MNHTKGPWIYEYGRVQSANGKSEVSIAKVLTSRANAGPQSNIEMHANGRLIAAAPDLFEFVQWYLAWCETGEGDTSPRYQYAKCLISEVQGPIPKRGVKK